MAHGRRRPNVCRRKVLVERVLRQGWSVAVIDHFNNIIRSCAAHTDFWHIDGAESSVTGTLQ